MSLRGSCDSEAVHSVCEPLSLGGGVDLGLSTVGGHPCWDRFKGEPKDTTYFAGVPVRAVS